MTAAAKPHAGDYAVTDYGAAPGSDCTAAFEAAIAAAAASVAAPGRKGAVVSVPAAAPPYLLTRPLFPPPWVCLRGGGRDCSRLLMSEVTALPCVVLGVSSPADPAADRPDLAGFLDPTAGRRYGVSTARGNVLQLDGWAALGPWRDSVQDWSYWEGVTALTLDLAFARPPSGPGLPVLGPGEWSTATARPWLVVTHPGVAGWYQVYLATGRSAGEDARCDLGVTLCAPPGARRLSAGFDLTAWSFRAWADGIEVPVQVSGTRADGLSLRANTDWPLLVGASGYGPNSPVPPLVLAGLRVTEGPRYAPGGVGTPQRFADGTPALGSDGRVYFSRDAATVFYLPLDAPDRRWLAVTDGRGYAGAAHLIAPPLGAVGRQWVRDLSLEGRGPGLQLGAVDSFTAADCSFRSDFDAAVGSVAGVTSYPTALTRCLFGLPESGALCGVRLGLHHLSLRDCRWDGYGYAGLTVRGTPCAAGYPFFGPSRPSTRAAVRFLPWGGFQTPFWSVTDMVLDCEAGPPTVAAVEAWQTPVDGAALDVDRLTTGALSDGKAAVPAVRLFGWAGAKAPAAARVGRLCVPGAACDVLAGAGWTADAGAAGVTREALP